MAYELPGLPYAVDALEPIISSETIDYHYGKHHQAYVTNLNNLVAGTDFEGATLEDIILKADGAIFNNGAQVWNHTFYWNGLSPDGGGRPSGALGEAIDAAFGSFEAFREAFNKSAVGNFGSGWTWLVKNDDGGVEIVNTSNAANPMRDGKRQLRRTRLSVVLRSTPISSATPAVHWSYSSPSSKTHSAQALFSSLPGQTTGGTPTTPD